MLQGTGTELDPFLIGTVAELMEFGSDELDYKNQYVKQTADISLEGYSWTPKHLFWGTYDGDNHSIINMTSLTWIEDTYEYEGVIQYSSHYFGWIYSNLGTIKNLTFSGNDIINQDNNRDNYRNQFFMGLMVHDNYGTLQNCHNEINLIDFTEVGGLCYYSSAGYYYEDWDVDNTSPIITYPRILDCTNRGNIVAKYCEQTQYGYRGGSAGGIAYDLSGEVTNCINYGNVSGAASVGNGGIAGYYGNLDQGGDTDLPVEMTNCKNYGNIEGEYIIGGLCGSVGGSGVNQTFIRNCVNYGNISIGAEQLQSGWWSEVGGLVGYNAEGVFEYCGNEGTISGPNQIGGLCGYASYSYGVFRHCYNKGNVTQTDLYLASEDYYAEYNGEIGGIVGFGYCSIESCYNEGTISGGYEIGGIAGNLSLGSDYNDDYTAQIYNYFHDCYNIGSILYNSNLYASQYNGKWFGGIAGSFGGRTELGFILSNLLNYGIVEGNEFTHDLLGDVYFQNAGVTISNCDKYIGENNPISLSFTGIAPTIVHSLATRAPIPTGVIGKEIIGSTIKIKWNHIPTAGIYRLEIGEIPTQLSKTINEIVFTPYSGGHEYIVIESVGINENGLWHYRGVHPVPEDYHWSWNNNVNSYEYDMQKDEKFDITPAQWLDFTNEINYQRGEQSLDPYPFTTTSSFFQQGEPFYYWMFNEAREALALTNEMYDAGIGLKIYANYMNYMKDVLNTMQAY